MFLRHRALSKTPYSLSTDLCPTGIFDIQLHPSLSIPCESNHAHAKPANPNINQSPQPPRQAHHPAPGSDGTDNSPCARCCPSPGSACDPRRTRSKTRVCNWRLRVCQPRTGRGMLPLAGVCHCRRAARGPLEAVVDTVDAVAAGPRLVAGPAKLVATLDACDGCWLRLAWVGYVTWGAEPCVGIGV